MTAQAIGNAGNRFLGFSTDIKPCGASVGATFLELDSGWLWISNGTGWIPKSIPNAVNAFTTIDLKQAAGAKTLFTATAQDIFIDAISIIVPNNLIAETIFTGISIESTDVIPVTFLSSTNGAKANLTGNFCYTYQGPVVVASTKLITLTIIGGATAEACVCNVFASWRPVVEGGYLA